MDNRALESGAAAAPPSAPTSPSMGYPTKGNPSAGTPASKGGVYWHYQIGEELRAILVAAGITPDHTNLTQLLSAIRVLDNIAAPVGSVVFVSQTSAPTGFLKANGAAISRTTYSALFAIIGTTFGVGDGSTTFNLPDLRGEFLRGWDDTRGIDAGRVFGSAQADDFKAHAHLFSLLIDTSTSTFNGTATGAITADSANSGVSATQASTESVGGVETRPRNVALLACIKY